MNPKVYLAGPGVFRRDAIEFGNRLKRISTENGLDPLWPLDAPIETVAGADHASAIFDGCISMLERAQVVVADITPFRGVHMDPGTAFEIGFAFARKLPIFLFSLDPLPLLARVHAERGPDAKPRDQNGFEVEDFSLAENLMICISAIATHRTPEEAVAAAATHMRGLQDS